MDLITDHQPITGPKGPDQPEAASPPSPPPDTAPGEFDAPGTTEPGTTEPGTAEPGTAESGTTWSSPARGAPGSTTPDAPAPGLPPPGFLPPGSPPPGSPPPGTPPPAGGWDAPPPPPPADHPRRPLRRDTHNKMLGGVASGLARYLEVDPLVVRIGFVVLAILWGTGVLLYLAAWLLIPADDSHRAVVQDLLEARPRRRSLFALVIGTIIAVVALSNLFSSGPWWPHWDGGLGGFGFFSGLAALGLAAALVLASGRRDGSPVRWFLLTAVVTVLAVVAVVVATVFSVEALSGVPLRGGVGDTQWRPTSASQVAPSYRLAIGNMRVDLRDVTFRPGTTHITATVGIGHLVVDLPAGPSVSVKAHSGVGDVQMFGQDYSGISPGRTAQASANSANATNRARIVLDAETGVGQVQVFRGGDLVFP